MLTPREQALAEGFKDEICVKCGTLFEAQIHFIRCDASDCPMKSKTETRSVLEQVLGIKSETTSLVSEIIRFAEKH